MYGDHLSLGSHITAPLWPGYRLGVTETSLTHKSLRPSLKLLQLQATFLLNAVNMWILTSK